MTEEVMRTIAYLCPSCHKAVIAQRSVFQLAASPCDLPCPCGKSALHVELMGDRVRLTVPCRYCKGEHTVTCPAKAFFKEKTLAFSCGTSGLDCCYAGEEKPVFDAMERLEEAADKIAAAPEDMGTFLDERVMQEVLAEVKEIAARGGISCACGSKKWKIQINYSSVDLFCADCGAAMRIPAATDRDMDDICCKNTLLIRGKR